MVKPALSIPDDNMKKKVLIGAALLSLAAVHLFTYGEVLGYYFTSMDAFPLLATAMIESPGDLVRVLTSPLGGGFPFGTYYRPVSELSYGIDYLIWGKNPMGYHLTAVVLHFLNVILVFGAAFFIFAGKKRVVLWSWLAACLFLLNPVNAVIIPSISKRQELLYTFLFCLSVIFFLKWIRSAGGFGWYWASLASGFLSIFTKETAFVLPAVIWISGFMFIDRGGHRQRAIHSFIYAWPYAGFAFLNILLHLYLFREWGVEMPASIYQHVNVAARALFTLFWPLGLLEMSNPARAGIFMVVSTAVLVLFVVVLTGRRKRDFILSALGPRWKVSTYLAAVTGTFLVFFIVTGKALYTYQYLPNIFLTPLVLLLLGETFADKRAMIITRSICISYILLTIVYSPMVTGYSGWRHGSEITRLTIERTGKALRSAEGSGRVYLVNWPGFIARTENPPGKRATILLDYSMTAWARWEGLDKRADLTFIPVSYLLFPSGEIRAAVDYAVSDSSIYMSAKGCEITLPRYSYPGGMPFELILDGSSREAELILLRPLAPGERMLLYDVDDIMIING